MVFLSWNRPSPKQQKDCLDKSSGFNYDPKYKGATSKPSSLRKVDDDLSRDGYVINHARVALGSGLDSFEKAKLALQNWRGKVVRLFEAVSPWAMMPLEVVYAEDSSSTRNPNKGKAPFLNFSEAVPLRATSWLVIAGEERFCVEIDENNQVWYEILSFSKPAHFLSFVGYPCVEFRQKAFARQSTDAVLKHVMAQ